VCAQLLSIPTCARCATTARILAELQPDFPNLRIERIALADHPELAERYGLLSHEYALLSAHLLVIEGELVATDHPSADRLRLLLSRARDE
jgi:hypothetical protein